MARPGGRRRRRRYRGGPERTACRPAIKEMPRTMKQLAVVQFFTWLGLFCMWMFFGLATAQQVFGATNPKSP